MGWEEGMSEWGGRARGGGRGGGGGSAPIAVDIAQSDHFFHGGGRELFAELEMRAQRGIGLKLAY